MRFAGKALGGGFSDLAGQAGTTNFGKMGLNQLEARSQEKVAGIQAESQVNQYGMKSIADMRAAELEAEAAKYAGQQAGQSAMVGGLMKGAAGLAGAGIQKWGAPSGTGNTTYTGTGGAPQNSLTAPLSTGTSASSLLSSFLQR